MSRTDLWLYVAQRVSAMVLAPLVIVHLVTIIYAIQGGLTAAEILERTQGNLLWGALYGLFVIAVAVHGSIGLRMIFKEMTTWRGRSLDVGIGLFGLSLLYLGLRAVLAVV
ncbi:MAG: succinate dehydrogenase [Proteobacteria bacterium]|nr:succinate dehydrogenase [Pseudomonadota bacterium]